MSLATIFPSLTLRSMKELRQFVSELAKPFHDPKQNLYEISYIENYEGAMTDPAPDAMVRQQFRPFTRDSS